MNGDGRSSLSGTDDFTSQHHAVVAAHNELDKEYDLPGLGKPAFQSPTPCMTLYGICNSHLLNESQRIATSDRTGWTSPAPCLACSRPAAAPGLSRHINLLTHCIAGTSQRTGRWHTAAVHNVTAIVGAGVLGLPYAMAYLTWPGGVVVLLLSWTTSLYTLWQVAPVCGMPGR